MLKIIVDASLSIPPAPPHDWLHHHKGGGENQAQAKS
jgi:hypothetical protein